MQGVGAHFSVQSTALCATASPLPGVRRNGIGEQAAVDCWRSNDMDGQELTALAAWVESVCKAMDKHNGEGDAK